MLVLTPVGWEPQACEALRIRFPSFYVVPDPMLEDMVTATLHVIYPAVAGRAPTATEVRRNRVLTERELDCNLTILALIERCEQDTIDVAPAMRTQASSREVSLWYDVGTEWQFAITHTQQDLNSTRPEEGGWSCFLRTTMNAYGDDFDPSPEIRERFTQVAAQRFLPGDFFDPAAPTTRASNTRPRRR